MNLTQPPLPRTSSRAAVACFLLLLISGSCVPVLRSNRAPKLQASDLGLLGIDEAQEKVLAFFYPDGGEVRARVVSASQLAELSGFRRRSPSLHMPTIGHVRETTRGVDVIWVLLVVKSDGTAVELYTPPKSRGKPNWKCSRTGSLGEEFKQQLTDLIQGPNSNGRVLGRPFLGLLGSSETRFSVSTDEAREFVKTLPDSGTDVWVDCSQEERSSSP